MEIGFAKALKKPIFIIIQDEGLIPSFIDDLVYVRTSKDNLENISYTLDKFLKAIKQNKQKLAKKEKTKDIKKENYTHTYAYTKKIDEEIKEIKNNIDEIKEINQNKIIEFFSTVFKEQGIISNTQIYKNSYADMSLWIDALEFSIGNPILVEVKFGKISQKSLNNAENILRNNVLESNARAGLLIYNDYKKRHFKRLHTQLPLIFRFEFSDLLNELKKKPLYAIILSERNKMAHSRVI